MNTDWIKITDRKPTASDLPVWAHYDGGEIVYWDVCVPEDLTHWMPAKLPAPPPKEKTQQELDEEGWNEFWMECEDKIRDGGYVQKYAFKAGLKWEREQVAKLLKELSHYPDGELVVTPHVKALASLRKRCGLQ